MENFTGFFLGANTKDGFFSLFEKIARERADRRVFVIKGGPGCGKNTLIRAVCERIGGKIEYIRCASDSQSLDGAILERAGAAIIDGTAPHVLEPDFPGAAGGYITMPDVKNPAKLREKLPELRAFAARARGHYEQSARLIGAAARLEGGIRAKLAPHISESKLRSRARGIASREFGKKRGGGKVFERFIDGVTPSGVLRLYATAEQMAERVYVLSDSYGLAGPMLDELLGCAAACGHEVYCCRCPLDTGRVLHLIIPALGLAFVTSDARARFTGAAFRNIRIDAYIASDALRESRGKLRLMQKISRSLLDDAADEIKAAHALQEKTESIYWPHLDIDALSDLPQQVEKLLKSAN